MALEVHSHTELLREMHMQDFLQEEMGMELVRPTGLLSRHGHCNAEIQLARVAERRAAEVFDVALVRNLDVVAANIGDVEALEN